MPVLIWLVISIALTGFRPASTFCCICWPKLSRGANPACTLAAIWLPRSRTSQFNMTYTFYLAFKSYLSIQDWKISNCGIPLIWMILTFLQHRHWFYHQDCEVVPLLAEPLQIYAHLNCSAHRNLRKSIEWRVASGSDAFRIPDVPKEVSFCPFWCLVVNKLLLSFSDKGWRPNVHHWNPSSTTVTWRSLQ